MQANQLSGVGGRQLRIRWLRGAASGCNDQMAPATAYIGASTEIDQRLENDPLSERKPRALSTVRTSVCRICCARRYCEIRRIYRLRHYVYVIQLSRVVYVLTNLYHERQLYNTLIPPSHDSPAVGLYEFHA